jgi:hypothetical protein
VSILVFQTVEFLRTVGKLIGPLVSMSSNMLTQRGGSRETFGAVATWELEFGLVFRQLAPLAAGKDLRIG